MSSFLNEVDTPVNESDLARLSALVKQLLEEQVTADRLLQELQTVEKRIALLSREQIPDLLMSKGITGIVLENGQKVTVEDKVKCNVPKDIYKRNRLLKWVTSTGGSGLIDDKLTIIEAEESVKEYLMKNGVPYTDEKTIHYQRLLSHIRGLLGMKKGTLPQISTTEVPDEASLFIYKETKIT